MNAYNIDYKKLALMLLPTIYRKPTVAVLAQSLVGGVEAVYKEFMRWRKEKDYRLWHNGQTCYLRAVLNDEFDPTARGITVTDGKNGDPVELVVWKRSEGRPKIMRMAGTGNGLMLNRRGFGSRGYDFWVNVPIRVRPSSASARKLFELALDAKVNDYKLASKRWALNYV